MGLAPITHAVVKRLSRVDVAKFVAMFELLVAVFVGVFAVLVAFYLRPKWAKKGKPNPGWNNDPADPVMGDLRKASSFGSLAVRLVAFTTT